MTDVRYAIIKAIDTEKRKLPGNKKRDRTVFGYMEPVPDIEDFANCSSCSLFLKTIFRCYWFSRDFKVKGSDSCIMYVPGMPNEDEKVKPVNSLDPATVGFYHGQVRCENCDAFDAKDKDRIVCNLYIKLNKRYPDTFDLDTVIKPHGCCNAFFPK